MLRSLFIGCFSPEAVKKEQPPSDTQQNTTTPAGQPSYVDDSAVCNILIDASGRELHTCSAAQGADRSLRKWANLPEQRQGLEAVMNSLRHHSSPDLPSQILPATFLRSPDSKESTQSGPHCTIPAIPLPADQQLLHQWDQQQQQQQQQQEQQQQQQQGWNPALNSTRDDNALEEPSAAIMDPTSVASQVHALLAQHDMSAGNIAGLEAELSELHCPVLVALVAPYQKHFLQQSPYQQQQQQRDSPPESAQRARQSREYSSSKDSAQPPSSNQDLQLSFSSPQVYYSNKQTQDTKPSEKASRPHRFSALAMLLDRREKATSRSSKDRTSAAKGSPPRTRTWSGANHAPADTPLSDTAAPRFTRYSDQPISHPRPPLSSQPRPSLTYPWSANTKEPHDSAAEGRSLPSQADSSRHVASEPRSEGTDCGGVARRVSTHRSISNSFEKASISSGLTGMSGSSARNRLASFATNVAARTMLGVYSTPQCDSWLELHISQDPSLLLMLDELLRDTQEGGSSSMQHFIPVHHHNSVSKAGLLPPSFSHLPYPLTEGPGFLLLHITCCVLPPSDDSCEPERALVFQLRQPSTACAACAARSASQPLVPPSHMGASLQGNLVAAEGVEKKGEGEGKREIKGWQRLQQGPLHVGGGEVPCSDESLYLQLVQQQQLQYMAFSHAPVMITVIDAHGRVVFQNGRSASYMGLASTAGSTRCLQSQGQKDLDGQLHLLEQLFSMDTCALESLLHELSRKQSWSGLVRMPHELSLKQTDRSSSSSSDVQLHDDYGKEQQQQQQQQQQRTATTETQHTQDHHQLQQKQQQQQRQLHHEQQQQQQELDFFHAMYSQHPQVPLLLQHQEYNTAENQHGIDHHHHQHHHHQQQQQEQEDRECFEGHHSSLSFVGNGSSPPSHPINIPYSQSGHACSDAGLIEVGVADLDGPTRSLKGSPSNYSSKSRAKTRMMGHGVAFAKPSSGSPGSDHPHGRVSSENRGHTAPQATLTAEANSLSSGAWLSNRFPFTAGTIAQVPSPPDSPASKGSHHHPAYQSMDSASASGGSRKKGPLRKSKKSWQCLLLDTLGFSPPRNSELPEGSPNMKDAHADVSVCCRLGRISNNFLRSGDRSVKASQQQQQQQQQQQHNDVKDDEHNHTSRHHQEHQGQLAIGGKEEVSNADSGLPFSAARSARFTHGEGQQSSTHPGQPSKLSHASTPPSLHLPSSPSRAPSRHLSNSGSMESLLPLADGRHHTSPARSNSDNAHGSTRRATLQPRSSSQHFSTALLEQEQALPGLQRALQLMGSSSSHSIASTLPSLSYAQAAPGASQDSSSLSSHQVQSLLAFSQKHSQNLDDSRRTSFGLEQRHGQPQPHAASALDAHHRRQSMSAPVPMPKFEDTEDTDDPWFQHSPANTEEAAEMEAEALAMQMGVPDEGALWSEVEVMLQQQQQMQQMQHNNSNHNDNNSSNTTYNNNHHHNNNNSSINPLCYDDHHQHHQQQQKQQQQQQQQQQLQQSLPPSPQQQQQQQREEVESLEAGSEGRPLAPCWHHIVANCTVSPVTGSNVIVLTQYDVSRYVNAELEVKAILDLDHSLLEQVFPQHVLQAIALNSQAARRRSLTGMAFKGGQQPTRAAAQEHQQAHAGVFHNGVFGDATKLDTPDHSLHSHRQFPHHNQLHGSQEEPTHRHSQGSYEHPSSLQHLMLNRSSSNASASPTPSSCGGGGAGLVRSGPWGPSSSQGGWGVGRLGSIDETEAGLSATLEDQQEAVKGTEGDGAARVPSAKGTASPTTPARGSCKDSDMTLLPGPPPTALQLDMSSAAERNHRAMSASAFAEHDHLMSRHSSPPETASLAASCASARRAHTTSTATPLSLSHRTPKLKPIITPASCTDGQTTPRSPASIPNTSGGVTSTSPTACAEHPWHQQELMVVGAGSSSHEGHAFHGSSQALSAGNNSSAHAALRAAHADDKAMTVHGGSFFYSAVEGQGPPQEGAGAPSSLNLSRSASSGTALAHFTEAAAHGAQNSASGTAKPRPPPSRTASASIGQAMSPSLMGGTRRSTPGMIYEPTPLYVPRLRSSVPRQSPHPQPNPSQLASGLGCHHAEVTVMFADIKSFTSMCSMVSPIEVMTFLDSLFTRFDALVDAQEQYGVYKVETIGDCYMVAGGLLKREAGGPHTIWSRDSQAGNEDLNPAARIHALAVDMLCAAKSVPMPTTGGHVELRIGMHTGPCVSGIVGHKMPRFCLFGNTVNKAARMETTSEANAIHASWDTWLALGQPWHDSHWRPTNGVQAKGIGLMQTMLWREDHGRRG